MRSFLALSVALAILVGCGERGAPGNIESAGPFQVTLNTRPSPPAFGRVELVAHVTRDGKSVTGATVTAATSMPSMNMPGPDIPLTLYGSEYSGSLNMMKGQWKIVVKVSSGGETGETSYSFDVK